MCHSSQVISCFLIFLHPNRSQICVVKLDYGITFREICSIEESLIGQIQLIHAFFLSSEL